MSGALVISLDFELHWGVRDKRTVASYRDHLAGAREVIPALLDRFEERGIHATWATVGFLFCRSRDQILDVAPDERPDYDRPGLSPYVEIGEIGDDAGEDPFHFAPNVVEQIRDTPHQEVASHTFSHFYCLEPGASRSAFRADLRAAQAAAKRLDIDLRSLVFPRNQSDPTALSICGELGFDAVRGNPASWLYNPRTDDERGSLIRGLQWLDSMIPLTRYHTTPYRQAAEGGVVDVPASAFLRTSGNPVVRRMRSERIRQGLSRAAERDEIFHLWWHPHNFGADPEAGFGILDPVLDRFETLRDETGMASLTMAEVADRTSEG